MADNKKKMSEFPEIEDATDFYIPGFKKEGGIFVNVKIILWKIIEYILKFTTKFKGYYETYAGLVFAHPHPVMGDYAWVSDGNPYPGTVYIATSAGGWTDTREAPDVPGVNLGNYTLNGGYIGTAKDLDMNKQDRLYTLGTRNYIRKPCKWKDINGKPLDWDNNGFTLYGDNGIRCTSPSASIIIYPTIEEIHDLSVLSWNCTIQDILDIIVCNKTGAIIANETYSDGSSGLIYINLPIGAASIEVICMSGDVFDWFQLEKGTIRSDFRPAMEDVIPSTLGTHNYIRRPSIDNGWSLDNVAVDGYSIGMTEASSAPTVSTNPIDFVKGDYTISMNVIVHGDIELRKIMIGIINTATDSGPYYSKIGNEVPGNGILTFPVYIDSAQNARIDILMMGDYDMEVSQVQCVQGLYNKDFEPDITDEFDKKVDKVAGKVLSTNDFDNPSKQKLNDLPTNEALNTAFGKKADKTTATGDITYSSLTTPADGDILVREGGKWVNSPNILIKDNSGDLRYLPTIIDSLGQIHQAVDRITGKLINF